jgi:hypothetical protein
MIDLKEQYEELLQNCYSNEMYVLFRFLSMLDVDYYTVGYKELTVTGKNLQYKL